MYTSKANLTHVGHTLLYGTNANKTITNKQKHKTIERITKKGNWSVGRMFIESNRKQNKTKTEHLISVTVNLLQKKTKVTK